MYTYIPSLLSLPPPHPTHLGQAFNFHLKYTFDTQMVWEQFAFHDRNIKEETVKLLTSYKLHLLAAAILEKGNTKIPTTN